MKIAHILRKYNPSEWGGTESATLNLVEGLNRENIHSFIYCPELKQKVKGPFEKLDCTIRRFKSFLPICGLSENQIEKMTSIGGNLMSYQLIKDLYYEKDLSIIHSHTLGLLGAIGLKLARWKKIPFILTIHGGVLDLPDEVKKSFQKTVKGGVNWGKIFSLIFGSKNLLRDADLILTCNPREAELIKKKYPSQNVIITSHYVNVSSFETDYRKEAINRYPQFNNKDILLVLSRIDPIKNQKWLIEQLPYSIKKYPNIKVVFIGSITDYDYLKEINYLIKKLDLEDYIEFLGGLSNQSPELIGLLQYAKAIILPSISEQFGLVVLEAWASGTVIISSRTNGSLSLINDREDGLLFSLENPKELHQCIDEAMKNQKLRQYIVSNALKKVKEKFDIVKGSQILRSIYLSAVKEKGYEVCNPS